MTAGTNSFPASVAVTIGLACLLAVLLAVMAYRAWKRGRVSPEERERWRRRWLVSTGKMGDATLVEIRGDVLFYSYEVRGVEYLASQDIANLARRLPTDLSAVGAVGVGAVGVKYDPRNPANSIVISEEWTGLRATKAG
jgi:hypothetical protein